MAIKKKPSTKSKQATPSLDEWETLAGGAFPPIWKPLEAGDYVVFTPQKVTESKNGILLNSVMIESHGGEFIQQKKNVSVPNGESFSVAVTTTLAGEGKLTGIDKKGRVNEEPSDVLMYSIKNGTPMRIVYDGKQKSTKRKGKFFHMFSIMVPKTTRMATS
jgi:hypothetical protein